MMCYFSYLKKLYMDLDIVNILIEQTIKETDNLQSPQCPK
jgi:hypothetical protein